MLGASELARHRVRVGADACGASQNTAIEPHDQDLRGAAEPSGRAHQNIQNGLKVTWRARDRLQDLCRGRLLLQRLFRLVEEASMVDRERGLPGKGFYE